MRTYQLREHPETFTILLERIDDAMPPEFLAEYPDTKTACDANNELRWRFITDEDREAEEISGDVLYVAEADLLHRSAHDEPMPTPWMRSNA